MKSLRTILVGLDLRVGGRDLTAGSRRAFLQALWLAELRGARLLLLHSTAADEYVDPITHRAWVVSEGLPPEGEAALTALLEECRARKVDGELVVRPEAAWLAITRETIRRPAELVMVGKRSDDDGDGRLVGSVANRLLRHCPTAVWAVKADAPPQPRHIVAASDLTTVGAVAIEHAALIADISGAQLHAVHAWQLTMTLIHERGLVPDAEHKQHLAEQQDTAELALRAQLRGTGWEDRAQLVVRCTTPSWLIRETAAGVHADLVVMGTISRGGLPGMLLGNTAERLLPRLDCSLLTVKPEDFVSPLHVHRDAHTA